MVLTKATNGSWSSRLDDDSELVISGLVSYGDSGNYGRAVHQHRTNGDRVQIAWLNMRLGTLKMRVEGNRWFPICEGALRSAGIIGDRVPDYYDASTYAITDTNEEYLNLKQASDAENSRRATLRNAKLARAQTRKQKSMNDMAQPITISSMTLTEFTHTRTLKRGINNVGTIQLRTGEVVVKDATDMAEAIAALSSAGIIGAMSSNRGQIRYEVIDEDYIEANQEYVNANPIVVAAIHTVEESDATPYAAKRVLIRQGKWIGAIHLESGILELRHPATMNEAVMVLREQSVIGEAFFDEGHTRYAIIDDEYSGPIFTDPDNQPMVF